MPCGRSAPVFATDASLMRRFIEMRRRVFGSWASNPPINSVMVIPSDLASESSTSSVGADKPRSNSETSGIALVQVRQAGATRHTPKRFKTTAKLVIGWIRCLVAADAGNAPAASG